MRALDGIAELDGVPMEKPSATQLQIATPFPTPIIIGNIA